MYFFYNDLITPLHYINNHSMKKNTNTTTKSETLLSATGYPVNKIAPFDYHKGILTTVIVNSFDNHISNIETAAAKHLNCDDFILIMSKPIH